MTVATEKFGGSVVFTSDPLEGWANTHIAGVGDVYAEPEDTDEYRDKARALGYGDDVGKMCIEHEYLHNWLSWATLSRGSLILGAVAGGHPADTPACWWEEQLVLEFQRYLNTGEIHGYLRSLEWTMQSYALRWLADHTYRFLWGINWHNPKKEAHA